MRLSFLGLPYSNAIPFYWGMIIPFVLYNSVIFLARQTLRAAFRGNRCSILASFQSAKHYQGNVMQMCNLVEPTMVSIKTINWNTSKRTK